MAARSCRTIEAVIVSDRLLGILQDSGAPMPIAELTRQTGLTMDTVFRQIGTMEDLRWVERIGDGYVLGMRLAVLWARRKSQVEAKIERAQQEIFELTGGANGKG